MRLTEESMLREHPQRSPYEIAHRDAVNISAPPDPHAGFERLENWD